MSDCPDCAILRAKNADLIAEIARRAGTTEAVQIAAHEPPDDGRSA